MSTKRKEEKAKAKSSFNSIGLQGEMAEVLAGKLNVLLANFQLFYINARGFHWNIKGSNFFELHLKFEEIYNDALVKIDEVAERILTLGYTPHHTFTDYLANTQIKEVKGMSDGKKCVEAVVNGYQTLLVHEREILKLASEANDEGTNALMSDYIREQEKLIWMYSSYLKG